MKILIAGGGNVGYYLAKTLLSEKHSIMLIESNYDKCALISEELGSSKFEVTCGDSTDADCLREADIFKADVFIAVTGQDQNNFVACMLAKDYFGVKRTISRVNNPKNIQVFHLLGVDSVISSTARIADIIEQQLDLVEVNAILKTKSQSTRLREFSAEAGCPAAKRKLQDIGLPKGVIAVALINDEGVVVPNGQTVIREFDKVIVIGDDDAMERTVACFEKERQA
ncbi:MAG: NAD-binding protein [Oscillospiraceae bacterium]